MFLFYYDSEREPEINETKKNQKQNNQKMICNYNLLDLRSN